MTQMQILILRLMLTQLFILTGPLTFTLAIHRFYKILQLWKQTRIYHRLFIVASCFCWYRNVSRTLQLRACVRARPSPRSNATVRGSFHDVDPSSKSSTQENADIETKWALILNEVRLGYQMAQDVRAPHNSRRCRHFLGSHRVLDDVFFFALCYEACQARESGSFRTENSVGSQDSNLVLKYRDEDGDMCTLVQETSLPNNHVMRHDAVWCDVRLWYVSQYTNFQHIFHLFHSVPFWLTRFQSRCHRTLSF